MMGGDITYDVTDGYPECPDCAALRARVAELEALVGPCRVYYPEEVEPLRAALRYLAETWTDAVINPDRSPACEKIVQEVIDCAMTRRDLPGAAHPNSNWNEWTKAIEEMVVLRNALRRVLKRGPKEAIGAWDPEWDWSIDDEGMTAIQRALRSLIGPDLCAELEKGK